jgi:putative tryptophan/tyrosine transport system substrate-binding protein
MKRREFIAGLGGAAAWPLAARAQQPTKPVIGVLLDGADWTPGLRAAFIRGLTETGHIEGRDYAIDYRNAGAERLREYAEDLVRQRVAVLAAPGSTPAARAARAATASIPIVFGVGFDPVQLGFVASLNRPGGNMTGYTEMQVDVVSKRLELLHALAPTASHYGALIDPRNPIGEVMAKEAQKAAEVFGAQVEIISLADDAALEMVFSNLPHSGITALLISPGSFFFSRRNTLIQRMASHGLPAAYWLREFPEAGGLMSYGSSIEEMHRQVGAYSGRILSGAKPADLPVVRATKFELVINAGTAKALGLMIPDALLAIADEVIQ